MQANCRAASRRSNAGLNLYGTIGVVADRSFSTNAPSVEGVGGTRRFRGLSRSSLA